MHTKLKNSIDYFNKYNELIGPEIALLVQSANTKPKITHNNYGNYLPIITDLVNCGVNVDIAGLLLIKQGANCEGVRSACRIIKGGV